ncbi:MAG: glycosyltransferase family 1 protein, partial [Pseudomonas sp.]
MKVLFLVQKEQRAILDRLYDGVAAHSECDLRWLSSADQRNLRSYFRREVDVEKYDRIVFFLRFKQEIRQVGFIRTVPNLVILEHDAYQNYIPCKYTGKFSAHYRQLPWARVISSGYMVSERLRQEGFDAEFVPKGYDQQLLA